jgi:hypothetical protein
VAGLERRGPFLHGAPPPDNLADAFSFTRSPSGGRRFDLAGLAVHDRRKRGMGLGRFEVVPVTRRSERVAMQSSEIC